MKREDVTNGIFISFLKQRVCEDEKVTVMLDRVAEGMCECILIQEPLYQVKNAMLNDLQSICTLK